MICTGYTAEVIQGDVSLEKFIMSCAKEFIGEMRYLDVKEIPEKFEVDAQIAKDIECIEGDIKHLKSMNNKKKIKFGKDIIGEEINNARAGIKRDNEQIEKIEEMKAKINEWAPNSSGFKAIKDFALSQIEMSSPCLEDYNQQLIEDYTDKDPLVSYKERLNDLQSDLKYKKKELEEEEKRIKDLNEWVQDLRESLKTCGL